MLQSEALKILKTGDNVFLTGEAGSGKTFVLKKFIKEMKKEHAKIAITASTGIAATHLGGVTIHSWSGIGIKDSIDNRQIKKLAENSSFVSNITDSDILIIDEVSMLDGVRLDMVNLITQTIRKSLAPFGGLQVVLCGDFFQLPPISRSREKDFVFNSDAWQDGNFAICYLEEQHRQNDDSLLEILTAIRNNQVDEYHTEKLMSQLIEPEERNEPSNHTILYTHNVDVDKINQQRLAQIDEAEVIYQMKTKGNKNSAQAMIRGCMAPEKLYLKKGAEVMFVANNFSGRYVNGTRGTIIGFDDDKPIVRTHNDNKKILVDEHTWKLENDGEVVSEITQLPLRLAWAITIHKSQGMSLDNAEIDLSRAFEPGMGYVALSRLKSLKGLRLKGINRISMMVNPEVLEYDKTLKLMSKQSKEQIA